MSGPTQQICFSGIQCTYNGILLRYKKEWNLAICDKMDEPRGIMLSEIHQREKDKYCLNLYIESKKQTNKQMSKHKVGRHRYRNLTGVYQKGWGCGCGQNRWRGLKDTNLQS